jgi:hypothetical protein
MTSTIIANRLADTISMAYTKQYVLLKGSAEIMKAHVYE